MSMTAQDVVNRATYLLNDSGNTAAQIAANTRWSVAELLLWIGDGERAVVVMTPNANNVVQQMALVAGTRQTLPAEGWVLISVKRNLTSAGAAGRALRQVPMALLDAYNPEWHTDPAQPVAWNYAFDVEDRHAFYVYPPNDGTGGVEVNFTKTPLPVTDVSQVLDIDDIYLPALANYVLYRAFAKDSEYAGGAQLSQGYYQAFMQSVGSQEQAEQSDSPNSTFGQKLPQQPAVIPPPTGRK